MGILSDPDNDAVKSVGILRKYNFVIGILCFISSLGWFVLLANNYFNNACYFSENALLPGLVSNDFNGQQSGSQIFRDFTDELESKYEEIEAMPIPWLVGKMSQIGLEVYTHNFSLYYPLGHGKKYTGTNVYGILRAPRSASLEAIVITAPYRPLSSFLKGTTAGIALMLAFAQFAKPQKYWAKDLIFLISEHEQLGVQAWLDAYHGVTQSQSFYSTMSGYSTIDAKNRNSYYDMAKCLDPGVLKGRSGSIQAAINLEFHTPSIKFIEVKIEGLNGQLPNLDLPNLVHKLLEKAHIGHSFKSSYSWVRRRNKNDEWLNNFYTMMEMFSAQMSGVPNGNHGLFHRFGIEAVTLEGRDANDQGPAPRLNELSIANFYRLGVALESILRSLNNLLERFHQSFFFYMLPAHERYISIGQYIPCLCLLCVAVLIKALSLWIAVPSEDDKKNKECKTKKDVKEKDDTVEPNENVPGDNNSQEGCDSTSADTTTGLRQRIGKKETENKSESEKENKDSPKKEKKIDSAKKKKSADKVPGNKNSEVVISSKSIISMGVNYLVIHLVGYTIMNSPSMLRYLGSKFLNMKSEISVYYGFLVISIFLCIFSPLLLIYLKSNKLKHEEIRLTNTLALIELATLFCCVGMHNFSLGYAIAVFYTPLAFLCTTVKSSDGYFKNQLKRLICLLLHPMSVLTIGLIIYTRMQSYGDLMESLDRGFTAAIDTLMYAIVDSRVYGNWVFNVVTSLVLPTWLLFWQILFNKVD